MTLYIFYQPNQMKLKLLFLSSFLVFILIILEGVKFLEMLKRFTFIEGMPRSAYTELGYADHIKLGKNLLIMKIILLSTVIAFIYLIVILLFYIKKKTGHPLVRICN